VASSLNQSGQSGRQETATALLGGGKATAESKTLILPNQMREEDNKALGIGYKVEEDKLYVLTSIKRKKKI